MASSIPKEVKKAFINEWLPATEAIWKVALYTNASALVLVNYAVTNEVGSVGTGYTAGGAVLAGRVTAYNSEEVYIAATNTAWSSATFTATHAIVYCAAGGLVRARFDFGGSKTVTNGTFTLQWNASGLVKIS